MTEHKKLKWICDKIGYEIESIKCIEGYSKYYIPRLKDDFEIWLNTEKYGDPVKVDPREIIFTPEFMEKYFEKCEYPHQEIAKELILCNLKDPIEYLYNLLLGK